MGGRGVTQSALDRKEGKHTKERKKESGVEQEKRKGLVIYNKTIIILWDDNQMIMMMMRALRPAGETALGR